MSRIALAIASLAAALNAHGINLPALRSVAADSHQVVPPATTVVDEAFSGATVDREKASSGSVLSASRTGAFAAAHVFFPADRIASAAPVAVGTVPDVRERQDVRVGRLSSVWLRAGPAPTR